MKKLSSLSPDERYKLIGKLIEEIKLRKYSFQTGRAYISVVKEFLKSGKSVREFLLDYTGKGRSRVRNVYFALKFFHENVLNERFDERIPLAKSSLRLPVVLSKGESLRMLEVTENRKHRLVLILLYYAGLRLSEVINLGWEDIDFERGLIHIKKAKGEKERIVFLHEKVKQILQDRGIKDHGLVLISERGKKYQKRTIQQIVKNAAKKAGIKKKVSPIP